MKKPNSTAVVFSEEQKQIIARILVNLRELKSLKQTDIGENLHLSPGTVSHYEKGRTVPPTEAVFMLADFYKVTTDYILGRSASKKDLNETYSKKLTSKMTIGDAVEIMLGMTDAEKEHLAYILTLIGNSKK